MSEGQFQLVPMNTGVAVRDGTRCVARLKFDLSRGTDRATQIAIVKDIASRRACCRLTDAEILAWASRHDIQGTIGELRQMAEDARTL